MAEKSQINIRIDADRKERWEEYAENDHEISGGLTGLIRSAVENQYPKDEDTQSSTASNGAEIPDHLTTDIDEIKNTLQDIQMTVERTDESVGFIERELFEGDERPFSDRLIRAIPPARPLSDQWEQDREQFEGTREGEPIVWEGTVDAFADALDTETATVEQSLEALVRQQDAFVSSATIDGERRYWSSRDLYRQPYADGRELEEQVERRKYRNRQEGRE